VGRRVSDSIPTTRPGGRQMAAKASTKLIRVLKSDSANFDEEWWAVCDRRVDSVLDVE